MKSTAARNVIAAAVVALALALTASTASAQEKSADNMQILAEKIKADKKLVVAENMGLTESEAKAFWPIYDAYQKDSAQLNDRLSKLIETYAGYYNNKTLTDANAKELTAEAMAIDTAELISRNPTCRNSTAFCRPLRWPATFSLKTKSARL